MAKKKAKRKYKAKTEAGRILEDQIRHEIEIAAARQKVLYKVLGATFIVFVAMLVLSMMRVV